MLRMSGCLIAVLFGCVLLVGCGGGRSTGRAAVYKVKGKVTMSGGPLIGAIVTFAPQGQQPVAIGRTNDVGEYALTTYEAGDGAAAGKFAVIVSKTIDAPASGAQAAHGVDVPASSAHDARGAAAASSNLVPAQYGDSSKTPLSATVDPKGPNQFDFEIK